ncbi:DUF4839 domain-containing protein [Pseudarthrobacter oxydans]|uniref:DUF4839 domain-containing protein n=1 Tax=Pseudarthrobacter oxydans TaxID=1671 RepID=UPI003810E495
MTEDDAEYEFRSMQTLRGTEARTIARLKREGWEFVSQSQEQLLRTKMNFRRLKPRQQPWRSWGVGAAAVAVIGVIAVGVISEGGGSAERATPPSEPAIVTSEEPTDAPSVEPSAASEDSPPSPIHSEPGERLTVENSADLAALLSGTATGGEIVENFAAKYKGRIIEFDGSIGAMNNHADYKTRYDILISAGDYSETKAQGPNFQFRDVGISDLNLTGSPIPDYIGKRDNLHVVARVGEFESFQELFLLDPISTSVR